MLRNACVANQLRTSKASLPPSADHTKAALDYENIVGITGLKVYNCSHAI